VLVSIMGGALGVAAPDWTIAGKWHARYWLMNSWRTFGISRAIRERLSSAGRSFIRNWRCQAWLMSSLWSSGSSARCPGA